VSLFVAQGLDGLGSLWKGSDFAGWWKTGDRREVSRLGKRAEVQQQDGDDENKNLRGI
jgi:hypothetical protein